MLLCSNSGKCMAVVVENWLFVDWWKYHDNSSKSWDDLLQYYCRAWCAHCLITIYLLMDQVYCKALSEPLYVSSYLCCTNLFSTYLHSVADHHGPPKVNFWQDPMNPSKWKEEHVSPILLLIIWSFGLFCSKYCRMRFLDFVLHLVVLGRDFSMANVFLLSCKLTMSLKICNSYSIILS